MEYRTNSYHLAMSSAPIAADARPPPTVVATPGTSDGHAKPFLAKNDPPTEEGHASSTKVMAKSELAARMLKELLPPPEVVQKFIDGGVNADGRSGAAAKEAAVPATEWLIKAVVHAHTDPEIKRAATDLLVTGPKFCANMDFLQVYDEVFNPKLAAHLEQLGAKLKTRFDELGLGTVLGEAAVKGCTFYHALAVEAEAEGRGLTMIDVLPDYSAAFRNAPENAILELYAERCYLLSALLLSMAVDGLFQEAVAEVARKVGLLDDAVRAAKHKSYVRARNKMDAKDDHRHRQKPRPAFNIDLIRCLAMTMTPEMSLVFYAALLERFGGAAKMKNLYALPEDERADRFNLVSLMLTVVFDPKMSYAELCQRPETQRIWDEYLGAPHGEPDGRWRLMGAVARRHLEGPAMASRPVLVLGEVQILLQEFAEVRHEMHSPYKCWRAADPAQLCADYLQGRPELMLVGPQTSLWAACYEGQCDVAARFIAEGADINQARTNDGTSPLYIASLNGHLDVARYLVSEGADINQATTDTGASPLHIVSEYGHLDVARFLVSEGADVNQATTDTGSSPLYIASECGHLDVARFLVSEGADVNQATTDDGASPLWIASQNGHLDVARFLVSEGADVNQAKTDDGASPLYIASYNGHLDVARFLVSEGADVNQQNNNQQAPLSIAASEGHLDTVKLLVESNANLNPKSNWGTPLREALDDNQPEVAQYLRSKGARE